PPGGARRRVAGRGFAGADNPGSARPTQMASSSGSLNPSSTIYSGDDARDVLPASTFLKLISSLSVDALA
ncbi:MAG: hypothetical protein JJT95_09475, partial [Pararhodobacter sp.]|nr:hypothetical protein [Pararhodobacter sp.]